MVLKERPGGGRGGWSWSGRTCAAVLRWMKPSALSSSDGGNAAGRGEGGAASRIL